ncbi:hypothetical protein TNCV_4299771 [Trichonephila clavipes]|nr:hypothetical protein TNCV_4299771 [Trichonephila clavipes]
MFALLRNIQLKLFISHPSDSESFRFKRPIYPWPMPCKDGKKFVSFPERTKLIRISRPEIPSTQKIEEMIEFVNPYSMPKPPPKIKPRPCGLPKYKMVVKPLVTLQLLYSDERGNKFQFAPSPQYHPFE